eukprot:COSAG02_NODE_682_length_18523_cov_28.592271_17_plen_74_part_00
MPPAIFGSFIGPTTMNLFNTTPATDRLCISDQRFWPNSDSTPAVPVWWRARDDGGGGRGEGGAGSWGGARLLR